MAIRRICCLLILICINFYACAQSFEGLLEINYKNESGSRNAVDVYIKGNKFYLKKVFGGCSRYNEYIYNNKTRILSCLSPQSPKTALNLDADKVLDIYEKRQLKTGYQVHIIKNFNATGASKKIEGTLAAQKKADDEKASYEIWTCDLVNLTDLIPILRVLGYWGDVEDDEKTILDSRRVDKKTSKISTINVAPVSMKVDDNIYVIPDSYQQVDLDKFLVNEYKSPRFGDLVKAFTGFTQ